MRYTRIFTVIIGIFCYTLSSYTPAAHAQQTLKDAYSVVMNAQTEFICKSATQGTQKESLTITILNRKGLDAANFYCGCDMFRSLQKFSGEILNSSGQSVRKIKKSDLQRSEYSSSLKTDDYYYFYECNFPTFPFTIKYDWEIKWNGGLIAYPSFVPQKYLNQSVLEASYRIELPAEQKCRYDVQNTSDKKIQIKESATPDGTTVIEATATAFAPILSEPFTSNMGELIPRVYFAPSMFIYDKSQGDMSTWQSFGEWQCKLLEGRDVLSEDFRSKIHQMTAGCRTDREKVQAVYDYLAKNTRYVSIQLGIGGLQPIPADNVYRTGFGDCKGLSNLAKAMLKELGIASTYTIISTTNSRLLPQFASANQMDHVILQVPLPQDTLWLECTNPQLPFGYVHESIAGHDALLIEPSGGRMYRLPTYPDSLNTQHINANITLSDTDEALIRVNEVSRFFQYENEANILYLDPNKQKERIRNNINLPLVDIRQLDIHELKEAEPAITFCYTAACNQYGEKTGNRLFIPANVFRKGFHVPPAATRTHPIHIGYGYNDTDSIHIILPEGYELEAMPKEVNMENKFGKFSSTIKTEKNTILIVHHLFMRKGLYQPEEYTAFREFRKQIGDHYNGKIIFKYNGKSQ